MGLLGHILSLKAGVPYEQLVKDRILNVLGMNDTRITLPDALKARLAVGHNKSGHKINAPELSEVIAGAGAFHSSATGLLKYLSSNIGLIHTKLDSDMQESHLIRHVLKSKIYHQIITAIWD